MSPATVLSALMVLVTLALPLAVYLGRGHLNPIGLALALVAVALLRACLSRQLMWLGVALAALGLTAFTAWGGGWLSIKLYPVAVNVVLLLVFAWSLWRGPPVIERLARITEPDLPPRAQAYTRRVTQVWCGFFLLNGGLAAYTAVACSEAIWALYTGLVAYVLMGLLFGVEWCVRQRVKSGIKHA